MPDRDFRLRGGNWKVFNFRRSGEMVASGPAGSGKTLANLLHLLWYGETYPGARMLIARKTRASLTESALVTWERDVLGNDDPILGQPINRSNRHQYRFPNGSVLVVGGLDRPDKLLSTEFDLAYIPEATDLELVDWETLGGRLRAGAGPYDLIFGDCNPTTPTHWIHTRAKKGKLTLIPTTHKDNPRWWDKRKGDWTDAGRRYVLERLGRLTGARRKRFLDGVWAAAEGLVYDNFDPGIHVHQPGWSAPWDWPRIWGIDFGFSNPLALGVYAIDGDGRLHLTREFYRTQTRVETLARLARSWVDTGAEPDPVAIVADHDPENVATFQEYAKLSVTMADKSDKGDGIEAVQRRFDLANDGRPRLYLAAETLCHEPDELLVDAGKPTCLRDELGAYCWDTKNPNRIKDEPVKVGDHHCDLLRYVVRHVDSNLIDRGSDGGYGTPPADGSASGW